MGKKKLLGVDPSLTCSGWALFALDTRQLIGVGKIRSLPAGLGLARRLADLQDKAEQLLDRLRLADGDVLVCEAPTTMRDPRAALLVEQVRGIFETLARSRNVVVPGRLNPRSVHYEVLGLTGRQLPREQVKELAVHAAARLYGTSLEQLGFNAGVENLSRHQDIVDAILVGGLALTRVQSARLAGIELAEYFEAQVSDRRYRARVCR